MSRTKGLQQKYNDEGGPAFPSAKPPECWGDDDRGMTLRDYFAAKAMQGMLAGDIDEFVKAIPNKTAAECAYTIADAMLAQRGEIGSA